MSERKKSRRKDRLGLSAGDWLEMVRSDMPDGAALAMAAEMAGMEYDEFMAELAAEAGKP